MANSLKKMSEDAHGRVLKSLRNTQAVIQALDRDIEERHGVPFDAFVVGNLIDIITDGDTSNKDKVNALSVLSKIQTELRKLEYHFQSADQAAQSRMDSAALRMKQSTVTHIARMLPQEKLAQLALLGTDAIELLSDPRRAMEATAVFDRMAEDKDWHPWPEWNRASA